jgi:Uracil DNA glycosylase superfamily
MKSSSTSFGKKAEAFFNNLNEKGKPLPMLELMNPYKTKRVQLVVRKFFDKFYSDNDARTFVFGINPGRFGCGTTGIAFTDPVALRESCEIENDFGFRREISSQFIYEMINEFGGTKKFYSKVFVTAIYPLALIKDGKNYNYYDSKKLYAVLRSEILKSVSTQISFGARREFAVSLGKKNADFLSEINQELGYFKEIKVLEHPRYIMQYRRKKLKEYIKKYIRVLE